MKKKNKGKNDSEAQDRLAALIVGAFGLLVIAVAVARLL